MAEQRIYLDEDNKLVVITDNGKTSADGTITTKIDIDKGFVVSGEDVIKLFGLVNKTDCIFPYTKEVRVSDWWFQTETYCMIITKDDAVKDALEGNAKKIESYEKEIKDLKRDLEKSKVSTNFKEVNQIISKYNNTRRWWERKIKID